MTSTSVPSKKRFAGLVPKAGSGVLWLVALLISGVVGGLINSQFNKQDNIEIAYKTQKLADIQSFQAGATLFDENFSAFNDALTDGVNVEANRANLRQSIAKHSSDTYNMERLFGRKAAQDYIDKLASFRQQVDRVRSPVDAMPMAQTGIDILSERRKIIRDAESRIGYNSSI